MSEKAHETHEIAGANEPTFRKFPEPLPRIPLVWGPTDFDKLSDQISEWREGSSSTDFGTDTETGAESFMASSTPSRRGRKSQSDSSAEAMTLKDTGKATA